MAFSEAAGGGSLSCMIKDIIIHKEMALRPSPKHPPRRIPSFTAFWLHAPVIRVLPLDFRHQQRVPVVGAVDVTGTQLRRPTVAVVVEQKQRVVADRREVPVVGAAFLLPMHRAFAGIHVEHRTVGSVERLSLSDQVAVHGHQPNEVAFTGQQLGLEPMQREGQCRTPGGDGRRR